MDFEEQIRNKPFVRLVFPLVIGIYFGLKSGISLPFLIPVSIAAISFAFYFVTKSSYSVRYLFAFPVFLFFISLGWYLSAEAINSGKQISLPDDAMLIASIDKAPKETEKSISVQISVRAYQHQGEWYDGDGTAVVYLQKDSVASQLQPGMLISFRPSFDSIKNAGNPGEFDYAKYMAYHMIASQTYLKSGSWKFVGYADDFSLRRVFQNWRQSLLEKYKEAGLEGDEYAVAAALSLGYKDKLQDKLKHAYSSSGAMHVLAVSGLHVGIIFVIMQSILAFMRKKKRLIPLQVVLLILSIWFYAMLTGLSPSVTRAAIMFSFISFGKLFQRNVNIYNILAASAFVTLIINPLNITELGFWLSYLAVLSIVMFYKPIYHVWSPKTKLGDKIWSLVAVSIAAQIGTAPLTVFYFHQFSNYFILTNILVIPVVTIIVYLAMGLAVFSFIPAVSGFIGIVMSKMLSLLNTMVFWIESLPGAVSENLYITRPQMYLLFLCILFVSVMYFAAKRKMVYPALTTLILFFTLGIIRDFQTQENEKFVVYNLRGNTGINCITADEHVLFTDFQSSDLDKTKKRLSNYWLEEGVELEKYVDLNKTGKQFMFSNIMTISNQRVFLKDLFIGFSDMRAVVLRDDRFNNKKLKVPIKLDYVIYTHEANIPPEKLSNLFDFELVIIDSSLPYYQRENLLTSLKDLGIPYHDVVEQGAFLKEFSKTI